MSQPVYTITITPVTDGVGAGVTVPIRLRQWLKLGLRAFGLRCTSVTMTTPADATETPIVQRTGTGGLPR